MHQDGQVLEEEDEVEKYWGGRCRAKVQDLGGGWLDGPDFQAINQMWLERYIRKSCHKSMQPGQPRFYARKKSGTRSALRPG
jgi:hypothetical protein